MRPGSCTTIFAWNGRVYLSPGPSLEGHRLIRPTSGWRWKLKTIRSTTETSKGPFHEENMAAAPFNYGTAASGVRKAPYRRKRPSRRATLNSRWKAAGCREVGYWCGCEATAMEAREPTGC